MSWFLLYKVNRPGCEVEEVPEVWWGVGKGREPHMPRIGEGQVVGKALGPSLQTDCQSEPPSTSVSLSHFVSKIQSFLGYSALTLPNWEPHLFPRPGVMTFTLAQDLH